MMRGPYIRPQSPWKSYPWDEFGPWHYFPPDVADVLATTAKKTPQTKGLFLSLMFMLFAWRGREGWPPGYR